MNINNVWRAIMGSAVVYVAMAACAGSGKYTDSVSGGGGHGGIFDPVGEASAEEPTSGTRLKWVRPYYKAEDGATQDLGGHWLDSMRGESCTFTAASDGAVRCQPYAAAAYDTGYSNNACVDSNLIIGIAKAQCAPKYARITSAEASCGGKVQPLLVVGVAHTVDQIYVKSADGTCVLSAKNAQYDYYRLGEEVAPTAFVAATLETEP